MRSGKDTDVDKQKGAKKLGAAKEPASTTTPTASATASSAVLEPTAKRKPTVGTVKLNKIETEVWNQFLAWRAAHPKAAAVQRVVFDQENLAKAGAAGASRVLTLACTNGAWVSYLSSTLRDFSKILGRESSVRAMQRLVAARGLSDKIYHVWTRTFDAAGDEVVGRVEEVTPELKPVEGRTAKHEVSNSTVKLHDNIDSADFTRAQSGFLDTFCGCATGVEASMAMLYHDNVELLFNLRNHLKLTSRVSPTA